ncbi:hypothetical protein GCM10022406_06780 [Hymenobacter algoricola]|uniref:Uncharacterized protein n=2 Tax=Hymenobacter algoricola TaxID=486267 RepID=A0ABP7MHD3_9BACT
MGTLLSSCDKGSIPAPDLAATGTGNTIAAAIVVCQITGNEYILDSNGNGAWRQTAPRSEPNMSPTLTGLGRYLYMDQTKFMMTPSGKILSVWEGTDTNPSTIPTSKNVKISSAWSECENGFESKCTRYTDGRVVLSLSSDPAVLPHSN